ncbi:DNA-directed RNA polymerases N/8 kDa subunit superfamily [Aspergillus udagawae]|uniref:DNA-directed RNA polymerases I, II, and III subunit RPABC5 n=1 Tax=Aspergillus udagawae TaxID=91492 RepID=A0A8H3XRF0_9EURO|nr:DNA-directed RNA polymerases N/8 kDa subunit superfamily [Aspergillus udagawae]
MIIPVRCFSCGKVVGDLWERYLQLLDEGIPDGDAMDQLGCKRYCCRRMIMTHVDLIEKLLRCVQSCRKRSGKISNMIFSVLWLWDLLCLHTLNISNLALPGQLDRRTGLCP